MSEIIEIKEELAKITKLLEERAVASENKEVLALEKIADEIKKDIFEAQAKSGAKKQVRLLHKMELEKGLAFQELFKNSKDEIVKYGDIFFLGVDNTVINGGGKSTQESLAPSRVALPHNIEFIEVFGGDENFFALPKEGNFLYAWGSNNSGCLGVGHTNPTSIPVRIETPARVLDIVGGGKGASACGFTFLMDNGKVYSTGNNASGEGGTGSALPLTTLSEIVSIKDIVHIARAHSPYANVCAVDKEGVLYLWGYNSSGCLGLGHTNNLNTPTRLELNKKVKKAYPMVYPYSGGHHATTHLLLEDGSVLCAGYGGHGALSQANFNDSSLFIPPRDEENAPLKNIKELYPASVYSPCLALSESGELYTWGYGAIGFGDSRSTDGYKRAKKIDQEVFKVARTIESNHRATYQKSNGSLKSFGYGVGYALGYGGEANQSLAIEIPLPAEIKDFLHGGTAGAGYLLATDGKELYISGKESSLPFSSKTLQKI